MSTLTAWHAGVASHPGLERKINEDRVFADLQRGVFLVVDGLGGQAAGDTAAEAAVHVIETYLPSFDHPTELEGAIRSAIVAANNSIYELASNNPDWTGMACVLTLAVVLEGRVTIGHVGDSRLYLAWNGHLRKLTSDHSPVGEQEDGGQLTEEEAMRHPRRNQVFRDVGSHLRSTDEADFIEMRSVPFRSDAALLLCSDGLSDVLTSAQISTVIEQFDGAAERTAQQLIESANAAGGKDNISVIFVPGPDFRGRESPAAMDTAQRHSVTRMRGSATAWGRVRRNLAWLLAGMLLSSGLWLFISRLIPRLSQKPAPPMHAARLAVNAQNSHGITEALEQAAPGEQIEVPDGSYLGPLELKTGVTIVAAHPGHVVVRSDPAALNDPGVAISARGVRLARIEGLRVLGDDTHPLRTGVAIADSSIEVVDLDISGAIDSGIQIAGDSASSLLANIVHNNSGPGIVLKTQRPTRLVGNWISDNGNVPSAPRAGLEIESGVRPQVEYNVIVRNGKRGWGGS